MANWYLFLIKKTIIETYKKKKKVVKMSKQSETLPQATSQTKHSYLQEYRDTLTMIKNNLLYLLNGTLFIYLCLPFNCSTNPKNER